MGYLCANFGLPRPHCSQLRPDVRDRQTDVRQHHRLMPPPRGQGHKNGVATKNVCCGSRLVYDSEEDPLKGGLIVLMIYKDLE